jgi:trans-aconitate 2-methyltransferase
MTASSPVWDPAQYRRHAEARTRPLHDLLARVPELPSAAPRIADLGCGPGAPTGELAHRWPRAHVTGYDNSRAMLAEAAAHAGATPEGGAVDFVPADLTDWQPEGTFDLLFSNAALQWAPGHLERFASWIEALPPGGVFAFQVPGNYGAPSHTLLHDLRNSPRWRDRVGAPSRQGTVLDPAGYLEALAPLGCEVDAWETTYLHLLPGEDPVLDWTKGTALRPVLTALADDAAARADFLTEYRDALRAAYPAGPHGTPFPFRRVFVVAVRR